MPPLNDVYCRFGQVAEILKPLRMYAVSDKGGDTPVSDQIQFCIFRSDCPAQLLSLFPFFFRRLPLS